MKTPFRSLLVGTLLSSVTAAASAQKVDTGRAASSTDATLDRALRAYGRAKTTRASFDQVLTNPLTGTSAKAKGELLMDRDGRLSIRFIDPAGDRVVADGSMLWVYLPSQNPTQVIRAPQGKGGVGGVDVMGQFFDNPRGRFSIADAGAARIGSNATHALKLTPKKTGGAFTVATVWVDDATGQLRQFEVTDGNGLVRRVTLTKVETNVKLDSSAFRFIMPKGAKLLQQPGV